MKLTTFIILSACLTAGANGKAQTITLSLDRASVQKVFKEVSKQTGISIVYSEAAMKKLSPVSIHVKNAGIAEVMEQCLKDQSFDYKIEGNVITVIPKTNIQNDGEDHSGLDPESFSQLPPPIDITGRVTDADGNPLIGATVKVKGTNHGTTTNSDGVFTLKGVEHNATLEISYVGYETYTIAVNNQTSIAASLKVNTSPLDEMQVIAYGTKRTREQIGNVTSVKAKDIERQPVQNVLLALEARVPGLFITQNNGLPGGGVTVRIQGQNSIGNGSDPLYVIDGVPLFSQLPATGPDGVLGNSGAGNSNGNPLSYLNPEDIESIDVLKDADATAIYGSRAANGAILITTKKGKAGQTKVSFDLQQGLGKVTSKMDMLNTRQYLDMRYEALRNDGIALGTIAPTNTSYSDLKVWDTTRYTDWQQELIGGTAKYTNISGNVSGGTVTAQYFISGTYNKQTSVFPGNFADQRGAVHFNVNTSSPNQKFRLQFSGNYMVDKNELPQTDLTKMALQLAPDAPALYKSDGTLNWAPNSLGNSTWTNPLIYTLSRYKNQTSNLVSNAILGYRIIPGLEIKSSFGYTNMQTDDYYPSPLTTIKPENRASTSRSAIYGSRNLNSWIIEPQITYNTKISEGKLDFLFGGTVTLNNYKSGFILGSGYNSDEVLENIQAAATVTVRGQVIGQYKYNALFSRLNYNWNNKYLVNLTARRDGSSRFGPQTQLHNFGSIGAGWIVSSERFMQKISPLSFLKLRASYGTTGNDQIGDYAFLSTYSNLSNQGLPYQNTTGLSPNGLPNPLLEWEETKKLQAGIDIGLYKDRILINGTYSRNRSSNQLLRYNLPSFVGFDNLLLNFPATVQNTSWEFSLQTANIRSKQFGWSTGFNLTIPKNKLNEFPNISGSTYANSLIIGQPLNLIRAYRFGGVDSATGKYMFIDSKGNLTSTPALADQIYYLNPFPRYYGGLENTFSYKNFELNVLFQFVKQKGRNYFFYNGNQFPGQFTSSGSNQPVSVLNRWQKPGDEAAVAPYSTKNTQFNAVGSDYFYTDASYIRLKNLSLSWQAPSQWVKKLKMQNARVYLQGQNLLTITNYKGMDPENLSISSLPPLKLVTAGVQVTF
jgi:TonB-linked SusC/RagA family outer membrane protein